MAIDAALAQMSETGGLLSQSIWKLHKIFSIQSQLVYGTKYRIVAEFINTKNKYIQRVQFEVLDEPKQKPYLLNAKIIAT